MAAARNRGRMRVLSFDDDEDDLVVCGDLGFDELGAVARDELMNAR